MYCGDFLERSRARASLIASGLTFFVLGLVWTSNEAYIGIATGVEKANDFRLVCDSPYCIDDLVSFKTSIREYVEGVADDSEIAFPQTDPTSAFVPEPTAARRMRLNPEYFKKHGYTTDCPGCV